MSHVELLSEISRFYQEWRNLENGTPNAETNTIFI